MPATPASWPDSSGLARTTDRCSHPNFSLDALPNCRHTALVTDILTFKRTSGRQDSDGVIKVPTLEKFEGQISFKGQRRKGHAEGDSPVPVHRTAMAAPWFTFSDCSDQLVSVLGLPALQENSHFMCHFACNAALKHLKSLEFERNQSRAGSSRSGWLRSSQGEGFSLRAHGEIAKKNMEV